MESDNELKCALCGGNSPGKEWRFTSKECEDGVTKKLCHHCAELLYPARIRVRRFEYISGALSDFVVRVAADRNASPGELAALADVSRILLDIPPDLAHVLWRQMAINDEGSSLDGRILPPEHIDNGKKKRKRRY